mgnify:CR=1 FL=1
MSRTKSWRASSGRPSSATSCGPNGLSSRVRTATSMPPGSKPATASGPTVTRPLAKPTLVPPARDPGRPTGPLPAGQPHPVLAERGVPAQRQPVDELVDVRDPREFSAGTIKGAVSVPINELEKKVGSLPLDKPVVFFCSTGARSGEAYDTVKLLRDEVKAYFLDADIKFAEGGYTIKQK